MKSGRRRNRTREQPSPADPARHQRCCKVCRHPDREFIEQEFLQWRDPDEIANEHNISGRVSIYRHAKATGLLARRRHNVCAALELLLERAEEATVSGSCIVRAVRLYARMNDDRERVAPPKSFHLTHPPTPALTCEPSASLVEASEPSVPQLRDTQRAQPSLRPASSPAGNSNPAEASEPEPAALPPKPPGARQARKPKAARKRTQPDARHERTEPDVRREGTARKKPTPNPTPNPKPDPTPDPTPTVSTAGYEPAPMVSYPFVPVYPEPGRSPGHRKP